MEGEKARTHPEMKDGALPAVPLTLEGAGILHQMFRVRWPTWKALPWAEQKEVVAESRNKREEMEQGSTGQSGVFSLLGHKGDLLVLHFRRTLDELNDTELHLAHLRLSDFLEATTSYLSVVELGIYEASTRLYAALHEKGIRPDTPEWSQAVEAELARQRQAMEPRLWPQIPPRRYLCFYPMD